MFGQGEDAPGPLELAISRGARHARTDPHRSCAVSCCRDWFLQTEIRRDEVAQRLSPTERFGVHRPTLVAPTRLAELADISVRQLERLFAQHLRTTIKQQMRLERAGPLLRQTTMPLSEIALATGFSTPMHFSRSYRRQFGLAPRQERGVDQTDNL